jgi:hypothetical protein
MASSRFEAFASSNFDKLDFTEQAGRYAFQAEAERLILADVVSKLQLDPADTLLVVGCGPGNPSYSPFIRGRSGHRASICRQ